MTVDILTVFPEMFESVFAASILGRAREQGLLDIRLTDIRPFSAARHKNTDDYPFGGGAGMVMTAQPIMDAMAAVSASLPGARRIYLGPRGKKLTTQLARELAREPSLILLGSSESPEEESFSDGLLEYPQYTRPRDLNGRSVPEVLLNGDHAKIAAWRRRESLRATLRFRPDLLETADLSPADLKILKELENECSSEN